MGEKGWSCNYRDRCSLSLGTAQGFIQAQITQTVVIWQQNLRQQQVMIIGIRSKLQPNDPSKPITVYTTRDVILIPS